MLYFNLPYFLTIFVKFNFWKVVEFSNHVEEVFECNARIVKDNEKVISTMNM